MEVAGNEACSSLGEEALQGQPDIVDDAVDASIGPRELVDGLEVVLHLVAQSAKKILGVVGIDRDRAHEMDIAAEAIERQFVDDAFDGRMFVLQVDWVLDARVSSIANGHDDVYRHAVFATHDEGMSEIDGEVLCLGAQGGSFMIEQ